MMRAENPQYAPISRIDLGFIFLRVSIRITPFYSPILGIQVCSQYLLMADMIAFGSFLGVLASTYSRKEVSKF
jgi:hypothetical protein